MYEIHTLGNTVKQKQEEAPGVAKLPAASMNHSNKKT
jgi:hypothetical protein